MRGKIKLRRHGMKGEIGKSPWQVDSPNKLYSRSSFMQIKVTIR